jgi:gliding motility-associated-like protein
MKRMLSFKNLLLATLAAFAATGSNAQTTIATTYTNNPGYTIYLASGTNPIFWEYITFNVENTNCYPVTITDMSVFHFASAALPAGTYSQNGGVYTLLYTNSNMPPLLPTVPTGYTIVASSNPITTASNTLTPILTGINFDIPANTTYRCALYLNDSFAVAGTGPNPGPQIIPSPGFFIQDGVKITTVGTPGSSTSVVTAPNGAVTSWSTGDVFGFDGSITFRPSGPTIAVLGNNACIGDSVTLTAILPPCVPATATINWIGPAAPGSHTGNSWTIEATQANAGQYFATWTDAGKTSAPKSVMVTVTPPPPPPTVTGKFAYCLNEQFEPVTANGTNILWYINPIGGTGTTLPPYVNTTQSGSYTWYASQTTNNGCESKERTRVNITVAPKPGAPVVTSPIGYCENVAADSLMAVGQNLKWFYQPVGGLGSIYAPIPNTSVKDTFSWWVSQTVDGCESKRSKIDVVVTFRPNGMVVVSREPYVCAGDTLSFFYYGSGTPTTAYDWAIPGQYATIVAGSNGPGPFVVRFDSAGTYNVTLHPGNLGCYGDLYVQQVKIKDNPTGILGAPQDVCKDAEGIVSLLYYTPGVDTFKWNWDGGITTHSVIDVGPYGVIWPTAGKKTISLTLEKNGCYGTVKDTITIRDLPVAKITGYDGSIICRSDSILLQPAQVVASSSYQWAPAKFFEDYSNIPVANARVDFDDKVILHVVDQYGCKNADSIAFKTKPCCEVVMPTAFTPNNDSHNDFFRPVYMGNNGDLSQNSRNHGDKSLKTMRIVNRWGQAVFESANSNVGWDGTMNGEKQDMGTYYYFISYECYGKINEQKGEVMLIR